MSQLAVVGCGHVGLVVASCFARLGHRVTAIDIDAKRVASLRAGVSPVHEPGLEQAIRETVRAGTLRFEDGYPDSLDADIVFLAVNTPSSTDGAADLGAVRDAIAALAPCLKAGAVIVNKSTVPIGTGALLESLVRAVRGHDVAIVANPEFLQEGRALDSFMRPDRVVLGSADATAIERVARVYEPLGAPIVRTDTRTAEMIKYASNAFLATKISFINEMAAICEAAGADVRVVAEGMGADSRIGPAFLGAGLGWGGSCFPKDVASLAHIAAARGTHPQLLRSVIDINEDQRRRALQKVRAALGDLEGRRIVVLGAAFKPGTDDTRHSPALELAHLLYLEGAEVWVHDPVVPPAHIASLYPTLHVAPGVAEAAAGAEALVLATEWPEYTALPFAALAGSMATPLLVDARNFLDPAALAAAGFTYRCIGRPRVEADCPAPAGAVQVA